MTKQIILLVALLLVISAAHGQTTISIGKVTSSGAMPREVLVPVEAAAQMNNIKSITMQFSYNPDVITFNYNPKDEITGIKNFVLSDATLAVSSREGIISISWVTNTTGGVILPAGKLFDLDFTFLSGFSEVRFFAATIKDIQGKRQSLVLQHGSVSTSTDPAITLISPDGGEVVEVLSGPANITWTSVYISDVSIEYSTDNGTSWNVIIDSYPAINDSYSWTVPVTLNSTECKIKISDITPSSVKDESDNVFTINSTPLISVKTPNGGEALKVDGVKFIRWSFKNIYNVKLEYSTNASAGTPVWNIIAASVPASDTTYDWIIPNTISADCKIRISDVANPSTAFDLSDAVFSIHTNPVAVTIDHVVDARVKMIGKVVGAFFPWWKPGYNSWQLALAHNEYDWNDDDETDFTYDAKDTLVLIGTVPVRTGWLTSVRSFDLSLRYDPHVLAVDSITSAYEDLKKINYSYENGIMHFVWATTQPIDLHGKIFDIVYKYISMDKPVEWLKLEDWGMFGAGAIADINTPTAIIDPRNFSKLEIVSFSVKNSLNDYIDASSWTHGSLSISSLPAVRIIFPEHRDTLEVNDGTCNILWSSRLVDNVELSYSTDGSSWVSIINPVAASTGTYSWTLPDVNSSTCYLRISDPTNATVKDTIKLLTITNAKSLVLKSPVGGEVLKTGANKKITWLCRNIDNIKLEYNVDGSTEWKLIAENVPAKNLEYVWTIPLENSTQVNLRISDMSDAALYSITPAVFTINDSKTKITISNLTSPAGSIIIPVSSEILNSATYFQLSVNYDYAQMQLDSVSIIGCLTKTKGIFNFHDDNGKINIVWYSVAPLNLSGTLFKMYFKNYNGTPTAIYFDPSSEVKNIFNQVLDIEFVNGGLTDVEEQIVPIEFKLSQNYPNPFNPVTTIRYDIPQETNVLIVVSNVLGERVATLINENKKPGFHNVQWKADNYASGIYYYSIVTKEFIRTKKMLLLK